MPVSSESGKADIIKIVSRIKHEKMLDIGCGCGTYAKLFPEADWTGVEIWEPYIERYDLKSLYQNLILADARTWEPTEHYDVAIAGDVLEHMTADEAAALLAKLRACADVVITSIPIGNWPQGAAEGNPYETHVKDNWTDTEVRTILGQPVWGKVTNEIGVYVWGDKIWPELCEDIPRKIHIVWVGDEAKRPDAFIQTWRDMNPGWEVKVWGNNEYEGREWRNQAHMQAMWGNQLHGVADLMRYEILYDEGGFCVDADSYCVKPLEDWLFKPAAFACWENETVREGMVAVGYMASVAKNPFFLKIINELIEQENVPALFAWFSTGPKRLTTGYEVYKPEGFMVWPSHYFIPDHFDGFTYTGSGPVFARQEWGTTRNSYGTLGKEGKKLKIAVYAISKNEEKFIEQFCNSAKEADLVLIADTGSTDGTVETAIRHGAIVHSICITPWRFDLARNASLALIPRDIDVCISLDIDEVLEPGWREEIERVWNDKTTRLRYFFDWGCGIKFKYEKIHARHGYMWHHPCHEYPIPDGRITEVWAETDKLLVSHHPDPHKSRGQYLDLLEVSVKEDPRCPRNAFYYARELSFHRKWDDAIFHCQKYLAMPEATWPNERCYAYRVMGQCYEEKGMQMEAEAAYHRACAEAPNTREPWCDLALLKYRQSAWAESYAAAMRALAIKNRELVYTCDPAVWGFKAHDLASIAAWHLGMTEVAIEQAKLALAADPENIRLRDNLRAVMSDNEIQAAE